MMIKKFITFSFFAALTSTPFISSDAFSAPVVNIKDERFFYEIGGAPRFKRRRIHQIPVGLPIKGESDLMCGNFNTSLSLTNMLNDAKSKIRSTMGDLEQTATGLAWSVPGLVWKRADPESYELFQNYKALGESFINVAVNSCEEALQKMENGGSLVDSVVSYSVTGAWSKFAKNSDSTDVVAAEKEINENKGADGIPWIGGKNAGGANQDPISIVGDTVTAGYNWLLGRDNLKSKQAVTNIPNSNNAKGKPFSGTSSNSTVQNVGAPNDPYFTRIWPAPEAAEKWARDVIGEVVLRTCSQTTPNCDGERLVTTPGKGVVSKIEERQQHYQEKLQFLVDSTTPVHREEDLAAVSTVGVVVTQSVIDMLRQEEMWQDTLVGRLAEDLAMDDTVEKFIALNRIFHAGMSEANLTSNEPLHKVIDEKLALLKHEENFIVNQGRLRELSGGNVIQSLYERNNERRFREKSQSTADPKVLESLVQPRGGV